MEQAALDFCDLIGPLTPPELSELWLSHTFKHQRGSAADRFSALMDWDRLWALIEAGVIPPETCRVTYARRTVAPMFYTDEGRFNPARLAELCDQGVSIIVVKLDGCVPAIAAACRGAAAFGMHVVHAGVIATTGGGGAFAAHYDVVHLIVLQVEGSKRWRVYGPRVRKPTMAAATVNPPQTAPILDVVLYAGDSLFLPAGYWHSCDNGSERSLHITLGGGVRAGGVPGSGAGKEVARER